VIERVEVELRHLPHLPEGDVVLVGLAVRRLRLGDVRKGGEQLVPLLAQLPQLWLELLELRLELAGGVAKLLELRIVGVAALRGLLDLAGELVLLGANLVDPRVQLSAPLVGAEQLVELVGRAAPRQGLARRPGVAADLLEVERGSAPRAA
jgi:hypothetical protein